MSILLLIWGIALALIEALQLSAKGSFSSLDMTIFSSFFCWSFRCFDYQSSRIWDQSEFCFKLFGSFIGFSEPLQLRWGWYTRWGSVWFGVDVSCFCFSQVQLLAAVGYFDCRNLFYWVGLPSNEVSTCRIFGMVWTSSWFSHCSVDSSFGVLAQGQVTRYAGLDS